MANQKHIRSTTTVVWADAVNNDANWTTSWTLTEYAKIAISDLGLAFKQGSQGITIEEIIFTGTGTAPALANRDDIQILIATDSGFSDVISFDTGIQSDAKYDTTVCIASFHPKHGLVVNENTELYITVKCGTGAALLADTCRFTVSQE